MPKTKIAPDLLAAALVGYEAEKRRIEGRIAELQSVLGSAGRNGSTSGGTARKHYMSAAARKRIAQAQKARWAKFRKEHPAKPKRKLSAEAKAKLAANLAKARAAKAAKGK